MRIPRAKTLAVVGFITGSLALTFANEAAALPLSAPAEVAPISVPGTTAPVVGVDMSLPPLSQTQYYQAGPSPAKAIRAYRASGKYVQDQQDVAAAAETFLADGCRKQHGAGRRCLRQCASDVQHGGDPESVVADARACQANAIAHDRDCREVRENGIEVSDHGECWLVTADTRDDIARRVNLSREAGRDQQVLHERSTLRLCKSRRRNGTDGGSLVDDPG